MPIQQILGPVLDRAAQALKQFVNSGGIAKWFQKNGKFVIIAGGGAAAGAAAASILKERGFKKRIKQIEKDNSVKFERVVMKEMEELRKQYKDNEEELRRKVNEYLKERGYDVSF